jgi:hypothetical protein
MNSMHKYLRGLAGGSVVLPGHYYEDAPHFATLPIEYIWRFNGSGGDRGRYEPGVLFGAP